MKGPIIGFALLSAVSGFADCPQLGGEYLCKESEDSSEVPVTISQSIKDGVTFFDAGGSEGIPLDGKINVEEWSVPQAAGGILLTQATCEDNAVVIRVGLNFGFMEEQRYSKTENGGLVREMFGAHADGPDFNPELFGNIEAEANEIMERAESQREGVEQLKKLIAEKAPGNWKAAKEKGLLEVSRIQCRKK